MDPVNLGDPGASQILAAEAFGGDIFFPAEILVPFQHRINIGRLQIRHMADPLDNTQAVGEILRKVPGFFIGDETMLRLYHGGQDTLKGRNGADLSGQCFLCGGFIVLPEGLYSTQIELVQALAELL